MHQSNRRGTFVVHMLLAVVLLLLIVTQALAPPLMALLLLCYGVLLLLPYMRQRMQENSQQRRRGRGERPPVVTRAARAAQNRVLEAAPLIRPEYQLQDIGLVIDERHSDGLVLRHARFISLDEESIRPYVVLYVPPYSSTGKVLARFQINDRTGRPQFIYEMEHFLHPGENLILPDYRLPLKHNAQLTSDEGWQLQVSLDATLLGIHRFHLLPSSAERLRQIQQNDGEIPRHLLLQNTEEEALPVSLADLFSRHHS